MTSEKEKQKKVYCHPALFGLSDAALMSVYKVTGVKKVQPGEVLVKEGDSDQRIFLLLDGAAQLLERRNGRTAKAEVLRQGDTILGASSFENGKRTASAVALEPVSALVLDEGSLNAIPPHIQSAIYRNLNDGSQRRLGQAAAKLASLSDRNERLTSLMTHLLETRGQTYSGSEMIQGILKGIPRLPMYANRLAVVILDQNVSTRDVAELAKLDPSLVSVVLKTVNSAYFGFKQKISDFQHAVLLLGFNQVYQLVMDVGLSSTMPKTPAFRELLFHSMLVSFVSFEISQMSQLKKAVAVSTIGLLHDIGRSVVLLLKGRHPKMGFLIDLLDQSRLGALLLQEWNIPEVVCRSLEYQSYPEWLPPEKIPEEHRKHVAVLYVAHLCCDYLQGKSEDELPTTFLAEYMAELKRPEGSLSEFVEKVVVPALKKKQNTFPEDVRDFIARGEQHLAEKRTRDVTALQQKPGASSVAGQKNP